MRKFFGMSALAVLMTAATAQIVIANNHARLEVDQITPRNSNPVNDALISCVQEQPFKVTHRFVIKDGEAKGYNPYERTPVDFCFNESGACAAGWHNGDAVYLRDVTSNTRSITRIDFDTMTMNVLSDSELLGPTRATFACTAKPLPEPRPLRAPTRPQQP